MATTLHGAWALQACGATQSCAGAPSMRPTPIFKQNLSF
jgi:hypothetical protein